MRVLAWARDPGLNPPENHLDCSIQINKGDWNAKIQGRWYIGSLSSKLSL